MTKTNLSIAPATKQRWTGDTADFFTLRLGGARAILITLATNVEEFEPLEGRASEEVITLSIEHVNDVLKQLETMACELEFHGPNGDESLVLRLSWARALTEVLCGMFSANGWKIHLGKPVLIDYLYAVVRLLDEAYQSAVDAQWRDVPAALPKAAA
jgi:hypothetical protein